MEANVQINASHFSDNILDFIKCLNTSGVEYVIVGGEAVIFHGCPRLGAPFHC